MVLRALTELEGSLEPEWMLTPGPAQALTTRHT